MEEKYGFVYIWFDRKHKRYYIGCHWGFENDGYICSSRWMMKSHKRRPNDFKRKILSRVYTSKKDLLEEEFRWLSLIKDEEISKRYYNLSNKKFGHWSSNPDTKLSVGQKISSAPGRKEKISKANLGKKRSEETKNKIRIANKKQFEDEHQRIIRSNKSKKLWNDEDYLMKQKISRTKDNYYKGFRGKHSEETKNKIRNVHLGRIHTEEQNIKQSIYSSSTFWINDGFRNKKLIIGSEIPDGYNKGKIKITPNRSKTFGSKWINNGTISKQLKIDEELPSGFSYGRIGYK